MTEVRDTQGFSPVPCPLVGPHPSWITLDPSLVRRLVITVTQLITNHSLRESPCDGDV